MAGAKPPVSLTRRGFQIDGRVYSRGTAGEHFPACRSGVSIGSRLMAEPLRAQALVFGVFKIQGIVPCVRTCHA